MPGASASCSVSGRRRARPPRAAADHLADGCAPSFPWSKSPPIARRRSRGPSPCQWLWRLRGKGNGRPSPCRLCVLAPLPCVHACSCACSRACSCRRALLDRRSSRACSAAVRACSCWLRVCVLFGACCCLLGMYAFARGHAVLRAARGQQLDNLNAATALRLLSRAPGRPRSRRLCGCRDSRPVLSVAPVPIDVCARRRLLSRRRASRRRWSGARAARGARPPAVSSSCFDPDLGLLLRQRQVGLGDLGEKLGPGSSGHQGSRKRR